MNREMDKGCLRAGAEEKMKFWYRWQGIWEECQKRGRELGKRRVNKTSRIKSHMRSHTEGA